jgi:hypothetical protein
MKRNNFYYLVMGIITSLILGCGPGGPKYIVRYEVDPSTPSPMTKDDVTIELKFVDFTKFGIDKDFEPLGIPSSALKPEYQWAFKYTPYEKMGLVWFPPVEFKFTPFWVKVTNNTPNILRMGDARIYLVVGEENYPALTKEEVLAKISTVASKQPAWYDLAEKTIGGSRCKFINDLRAEVMPRQSLKGFLFFDVDPAKASTGTLSFFDVTTKVDEAGKPIKKTEFQFKIIQKLEEERK